MRLEQLEYFIVIVKYKSMNLASEEFHVSQQTLSASVKSLEQELGVQLLKRSHVGVSVTQEGAAFLKIAQQFLKSIHTFKETYATTTQTLYGQLNIYATPAICASILPKLITLFIKKYNQVEINMLEIDSSKINEEFKQDPIATKLMLMNVLQCGGEEISLCDVTKELVYEEFLSETYVVVAGKESVLAGYKTISLKTLLHYPLIFCGTKSKEVNLSYHLLTRYGQPIVCLVSDNPYVYLQAIVDGAGIGIMPTRTLQHDLLTGLTERVTVLPIKEKVDSISYWAIPKEQLQNELLQEFVAFSKKNKHIFK